MKNKRRQHPRPRPQKKLPELSLRWRRTAPEKFIHPRSYAKQFQNGGSQYRNVKRLFPWIRRSEWRSLADAALKQLKRFIIEGPTPGKPEKFQGLAAAITVTKARSTGTSESYVNGILHSLCEEPNPKVRTGARIRCVELRGHTGPHSDAKGREWPQ